MAAFMAPIGVPAIVSNNGLSLFPLSSSSFEIIWYNALKAPASYAPKEPPPAERGLFVCFYVLCC